MENLHHIVVVGGGADGLELVTRLGNKLGKKHKARISLVGAGLTHIWKPLLHEVAAGSLDASTNEINYRAHARKHHFEFQLGRLSGLDRSNKAIVIAPFLDEEGREVVPERRIEYDTLVIAIGSTANDFGTPGAQENCLFLDCLKQTLQTTLDASIFAFGDCAACPQPGSDHPVPPRAQAAHQQAEALFKTLRNRLEGKEAVPFVYNDHGSLINFSRYTTVGNLMGNLTGGSMYIEGKVARLFFASLYRMHQVALHGFLRTGVIWLMDRVSRAMQPRLKMH